ncbi:uncharacterized protein LOC141607747 [Silene latifolia]|uniref:uncharacterized protein LOC141607747 n=1 Tax=Silene latifolia TaxID=37657 RepID=UPI003D776454
MQAESNLKAPKNIAEIRSFLCLADYNRRFVKDFPKIARPVTNLLRRETRFSWDESCEMAFQTLKESLTTASVLALPEGSDNFELYADGSKNGLDLEELDPKIQEWKPRVGDGTVSIFSIHTDGSVRFDGRSSVPSDIDLKKLIMTEAHCTPYSVHPGGDKLYKHLKKTFWWPVGDKFLLKVSSMWGVMRFGKRGKLSHKFRCPYEILARVGEVAYQLALPPSLDRVHNVFHLSQLRKYVSDSSHVHEVENIELDETLTYVEVPKEILDCKVRKTKNGETVLLEVLWSNHNVEEATWEPEEAIREPYPHLSEQEWRIYEVKRVKLITTDLARRDTRRMA